MPERKRAFSCDIFPKAFLCPYDSFAMFATLENVSNVMMFYFLVILAQWIFMEVQNFPCANIPHIFRKSQMRYVEKNLSCGEILDLYIHGSLCLLFVSWTCSGFCITEIYLWKLKINIRGVRNKYQGSQKKCCTIYGPYNKINGLSVICKNKSAIYFILLT